MLKNFFLGQSSILWVLILVVAAIFQPGQCLAKKKMHTSEKKSQSQAQAEPEFENKPWGLGLIIGDPTGVTLKYWQDRHSAFDFALGAQLAGSGINLHADYLYHMYVFEQEPQIPIYLGGGLFPGGYNSGMGGGVRGDIGITYLFKEPFDVFMQLSPNLAFAPSAAFYFTFSIGGRIYL